MAALPATAETKLPEGDEGFEEIGLPEDGLLLSEIGRAHV
jgi:hypothetical protein